MQNKNKKYLHRSILKHHHQISIPSPAKSRTFRWSSNFITRPRKNDKDKNSLELLQNLLLLMKTCKNINFKFPILFVNQYFFHSINKAKTSLFLVLT